MNDEPSKGWHALSRGERIAVAALLGLVALAIVALLLAVVTAAVPRSGPSATDLAVGLGALIVLGLVGMSVTVLRIWWVRQPNRHAWRLRRTAGVALSLFGFFLGGLGAVEALVFRYSVTLWAVAAASAWLGAGFIYSDARLHAPEAVRGPLRFLSYAITAAGVLSLVYAGTCTIGTLTVSTIALEPQGSPLQVFLLGLAVIVPASIIAGMLLYSGARLRR